MSLEKQAGHVTRGPYNTVLLLFPSWLYRLRWPYVPFLHLLPPLTMAPQRTKRVSVG